LRTIIEEQQQENGIEILPVTAQHTWEVEALPDVHKDPFDRLLIAQAIADDLTFASGDSLIHSYPVRILW
jgi:PIN domain nuclease of toxin-antitoxin system